MSPSSQSDSSVLDASHLLAGLEEVDFGDWARALADRLGDRLGDESHGHLPEWREAIARLPATRRRRGCFDAGAPGVPDLELDVAGRDAAVSALKALAPWRKGPFRIGDIRVDAEWQSNLKWERVAHAISPLEGRRVLDVGCGNGYYALRMLGAGARTVIGVDPTLLFLAQHAALSHFMLPEPVVILPLRLEELPVCGDRFDTVFSMGVLYHSRAPIDQLRSLREALRPGGELVLETIVLPGGEACSRTPPERYARMRNVWHLPTAAELMIWLARSGFRDARLVDVTVTTIGEQRSTEWMTFESLAEALDPGDPSRTVEGWPAPHRAVVIASRPD